MLDLKRDDQGVLDLQFHHGLGDVLVFRNVLRVLDGPVRLHLHPGLGQAAVFHGLPGVEVVEHGPPAPSCRRVAFAMENSKSCVGGKPTKTRICMEHEFGLIRPDVVIRPMSLDNLLGFESPALDQTRRFLEGLDQYVVCHFQGTWSPDLQNTSERFARDTVHSVLRRGYGVVLINYHYVFHNPRNADLSLVDGDRVRSTYQSLPMEFESLWWILSHASLFLGVDSGPLHAAACLTQLPSVYLQRGTHFTRDFYDDGLRDIAVVDANVATTLPQEVLDQFLPRVVEVPSAHRPGGSINPRPAREQADFLLQLYAQFAPEIVQTGCRHDAGRLGRRGMVYRTDAEVLYALIRLWKPEVVVDFCTGLGDALSYVLTALAKNGTGVCVSADLLERKGVLAWLETIGLDIDRLLLFDEQDVRDLLPMLSKSLRHKRRLLWVLDTNHEFEMGQWQLESVIRPYLDRSIFAKDDVVAVHNRLESDMGAIYAVRDLLCEKMEVVSTNAAFGAVSGLPCSQPPYRGAEGRSTPGAIPFRACRRNGDVQEDIRRFYPRWDGDANKMVFFWKPGLIPWLPELPKAP